jgi:hypothetical protein
VGVGNALREISKRIWRWQFGVFVAKEKNKGKKGQCVGRL